MSIELTSPAGISGIFNAASQTGICRALLVFACWLSITSPAAALDVADHKWGFNGKVAPHRFNVLSILFNNPTPQQFTGEVQRANPCGSLRGPSMRPLSNPSHFRPTHPSGCSSIPTSLAIPVTTASSMKTGRSRIVGGYSTCPFPVSPSISESSLTIRTAFPPKAARSSSTCPTICFHRSSRQQTRCN